MLVIRPDATRLIEIPGVPAPVRRPVDVDQAITGFSSLRTLRIYRFDQGSIIEGHAEEDEVYIVVLAGSLELTISTEAELACPEPAILCSPGALREAACAAYLSPGSSYKLIARSETDVAYARATPRSVRKPKIFAPPEQGAGVGIHLLLEDTTCAERLRFRLLHIDATAAAVLFSPGASKGERLIHITSSVREQSTVMREADSQPPAPISSEDTVAIAPDDQLVINFAEGSRCLVLIVEASQTLSADAPG